MNFQSKPIFKLSLLIKKLTAYCLPKYRLLPTKLTAYQNHMRLNKFISESGLCSRREADRYIERGLVLINGRKATIGDQVKANDRVIVNGHELEPHEGA